MKLLTWLIILGAVTTAGVYVAVITNNRLAEENSEVASENWANLVDFQPSGIAEKENGEPNDEPSGDKGDVPREQEEAAIFPSSVSVPAPLGPSANAPVPLAPKENAASIPPAAKPEIAVQRTTPKINEDEIMEAVVRINCGRTYGSGFVIARNGIRYALTAAHVAIDQILIFKNYVCNVIFPRKDDNGNYREAHYRVGKILLPEETAKNYQEKGIDLAILEIQPLADQSEDLARFPNGYPYIGYSFCPADTLGDSINLWGYSANLGTTITPGAFLSKFQGQIVQYENVTGVIKKPSLEFLNGSVYLPKLEHSLDQGIYHHLSVILSNNNFSGASGGLVFDTAKACLVGVNIATLVQDNQVFGFVTQPQFGSIKDFTDRAMAEF